MALGGSEGGCIQKQRGGSALGRAVSISNEPLAHARLLQLIWCRWRLLDCQRQVTLSRLQVRLWLVAEAGGRLWAVVKAAACCGSHGGSALGRAISPRNHPAVDALGVVHSTAGCGSN